MYSGIREVSPIPVSFPFHGSRSHVRKRHPQLVRNSRITWRGSHGDYPTRGVWKPNPIPHTERNLGQVDVGEVKRQRGQKETVTAAVGQRSEGVAPD
ncbi:hypothetical protein AAFF_G00000700 [Aldrovandia affinis]|uniref:Uncharacterized protein n=1 Tax=Aldrovandia affinis TaxID=143900 RepID=A0AAD7X2D1_9TELE|nr:hypothetical protein AAFF_G00000700 [Aldrovandia affinis]